MERRIELRADSSEWPPPINHKTFLIKIFDQSQQKNELFDFMKHFFFYD
jgi:hypothetical protein